MPRFILIVEVGLRIGRHLRREHVVEMLNRVGKHGNLGGNALTRLRLRVSQSEGQKGVADRCAINELWLYASDTRLRISIFSRSPAK